MKLPDVKQSELLKEACPCKVSWRSLAAEKTLCQVFLTIPAHGQPGSKFLTLLAAFLLVVY